MLEQIFDCEKTPSAGQENWLRVMAFLPEIKTGMMGAGSVNEDDVAVAQSAKRVMKKHNLKLVELPPIPQ